MKNPLLTVIVLSFNTKELLEKCLKSLKRAKEEILSEIIVVDNASTDGSGAMVKKEFPDVRLIKNKKNLGFAAGNNRAKPYVHGEYVLILNSDTEVKKNTLKECIEYLKTHSNAGAITCKIFLPDGTLDKDARRSFPTPWVTFTHFSGFDRLFFKSKTFSQYWYGYKSPDEIQEVDVLEGAFTLIKRKVLDEVGWYDEDYFLDGEDVDICWKIKKAGWEIVYYPKVLVVHYKKSSKLKNKSLKNVMAGVDSMEIFYKKHLWSKYPFAINWAVLLGIKTLKLIRYLRFYLT